MLDILLQVEEERLLADTDDQMLQTAGDDWRSVAKPQRGDEGNVKKREKNREINDCLGLPVTKTQTLNHRTA